jgi:hypothetical protein
MPTLTTTTIRRATPVVVVYCLLNLAYYALADTAVGVPHSVSTWTALSSGQQFALAAWIPWMAITALASLLYVGGMQLPELAANGGERA